MAETLVGGAFLSSALLALLGHVDSPDFIEFFRGQKYDERLLKKLKSELVGLIKVLNDAEDKQMDHPAVKEWLDELKDAVYDAEDLVDEIANKALRCKVEAEYQNGPNLVRSLISAFSGIFDSVVESELEEVIGKLDNLVKEKDVLGLRDVAESNWSQIRVPTSSLVDESLVYGRENDKEEIMKLLLSVGEGSHGIDVIPIVGMGGVGKTTLAQLVYNDGKVDLHFELKAWIRVSDVFDVFRITKGILESFTAWATDAEDIRSLQVKLKESLSGKRFLIVLDDVWNENSDNWNALMTPLKSGARGSKIIVTTRNENVASIIRTGPIHHLRELPEEHAWELFLQHAFEKGDCNAYPHLERIGKQLVRKSKGLPLAVKILSCLLRNHRDVNEWNNLLETPIWELAHEKSNILPALRLSFHHLPSHLKRCFAYCSIFTKGYEYDIKELVSIWIAEGILKKPQNYKTVEEEGYEWFHELYSRSFFQRSKTNTSLFVMHDLVHDLAQWVIGDSCYRLEDGTINCIYSEKVRHFSYVRDKFDGSDKLNVIKDAKCLRTFLPLGRTTSGKQWLSKKVLDEILPQFTRLRLLSLRSYQIMKLPDSIGNWRHLRFLDLSDTLIHELPSPVCSFYNLETLLLANCRLLTTLPEELVKLISLRRLDLSGTGLKEMPMHMSRLKNLEELSSFVVGKCNGSGINELKDLNLLRGTISISDLQNVTGVSDALEAKMRLKKHLEKLVLEWGSATDDSRNVILEKLEPHRNLKHLNLINYGGTRFPTWLGDQSFRHMLTLCLDNCKSCVSLPPLGQLPSLIELTVVRMPGITKVGIEFYGESGSLTKPFQSLKTLRFKEMSEWVEWCVLDAGVFPRLQELGVISCPKLIGDLPKRHSLAIIEVTACPKLVASLPGMTSMRELVLQKCEGLVLEWQGMSALEILKISRSARNFARELPALTKLNQLVVSWCPKLEFPQHFCTSLEILSLSKCDSLIALQLGMFPKLRSLEIFSCVNFENLLLPNERELQNLQVLDKLCIEFCPNMVSFPDGGLPAPKLSDLRVCQCEKLKALPERMHILLLSLQRLVVWQCPEIESFPEGGLPSKLRVLWVWECKKLVGSRRDWGLQTLPYLTTLTLEGESEDILRSYPEEGLLPSTLTKLIIGDMRNLKSLNKRGLELLDSLKAMEIKNCPQLKSLPDGGLPTTLSELVIENCPLLKPLCRREEEEEWGKVAHIPGIIIDGEAIFDNQYHGPPDSADLSVSFSNGHSESKSK